MKDADFFAGLVPEFVRLACIFRNRCDRAGLHVVFLEGHRTFDQQMQKYEQGRARTPHGWIIVDDKKIVTKALPDQDPHCRGAALDLAVLDSHERIDWKREDLFRAAATFMPDGLDWGGNWPTLHDLGHYEMKNWRELPLIAAPLQS